MEVVEITPQRQIHVAVKKWNGRDVLQLQTYITTNNYTGYTKKGITIPLEKAPELLGAIEEELVKAGLI